MTTSAERLVHRYRPVGSARELFSTKAPEVLLSGPAGTGKSRACLEKLHAMMLKTPKARGLMVRKTATSLTSTALVTFREHVAAEAIQSGEVQYFGGSGQEASMYRYGNGSTITVGGLDKATRIMSSEYDVIYVQEATELTEDDWEALTTRLRNGKISFQQLMADTNPGPPHHWLNARCTRGQTVMINCRHQDNPRMFNREQWTPEGQVYLDRLKGLTGVRRARLLEGKWVAAEGLIYEEFDPAVHLRKKLARPPDEWDRWITVDFGYRHPFTAQWWTEDADGQLIMYREIYRTGTLVEDHGRLIASLLTYKGKYGRPEPDPRAIICDHDAEGRATLEKYIGRATIPARKSVSEGIDLVKTRLQVNGDGKPGLVICRDALVELDQARAEAHKPVCLADELTGYVWADTAKEQPVKEDDDGCDAMRYMIAHRDMGGLPNIRFLGDEIPDDPEPDDDPRVSALFGDEMWENLG